MQEVIFKTTRATRKPEEVGWDTKFLKKGEKVADILHSYSYRGNLGDKDGEHVPNPMEIFDKYMTKKMVDYNKEVKSMTRRQSL
jgi:hypothetical protein